MTATAPPADARDLSSVRTRSAEIVVGIDEDPGCAEAVAWAAAEAASRGVRLRLVHAWSWGFLSPDLPAEKQAVRAEVARRMAPVFEQLTALARGCGARAVLTEIVDGYPVDVLASSEAALVVVGSHHLRGVGRAVLGSSSGALVSRSATPAVVVSTPQQVRAGAGDVVVGLSGGSDDDRLLEFSFEFAQRHRLPVHAVMCWDPPLGNHHLAPPRRLQLWAERFVGTWQEAYPTVPALASVVRAHPIDALVHAADGQSLLVVGRTRQRIRLGGVLGSTCIGAVRSASCPVAVVPPSRPAERPATHPPLPSSAHTIVRSSDRDDTPRSPDREYGTSPEEQTMSNTVSIEFEPAELRLVENALRSFLSDFGHDEADVIAAIRAVLAKLPKSAEQAAEQATV